MKIAFVCYPDFTALDLIGPYEVISRWPDAEVHFLARGGGKREAGAGDERSGAGRLAARCGS
jgi:putative intracellular protease/amidase